MELYTNIMAHICTRKSYRNNIQLLVENRIDERVHLFNFHSWKNLNYFLKYIVFEFWQDKSEVDEFVDYCTKCRCPAPKWKHFSLNANGTFTICNFGCSRSIIRQLIILRTVLVNVHEIIKRKHKWFNKLLRIRVAFNFVVFSLMNTLTAL